MKHGPFLFLGLLLALSFSWLGMVATPQFQLGNSQPTNVPPANVQYPTPYSGLAAMGREVYRANGCAYCHTQVVRQEGTRLQVVVTNPGTNETAVVEALRAVRSDLSATQAQELLASLPARVLTSDSKPAADSVAETLTDAGAEAAVRVVPLGPDIERGWGVRLSVAQDYLYQTPVLLGTTRLGPDLTNVGLRQPDPAWHLIHLYDPKLKVAGSTMPQYPFLFEKRPKGSRRSPDALDIPGDYEIVPKPEANALVAYLLSLRTVLPLFEAPGPLPPSASASGTNLPSATGTETNATPGSVAPDSPVANPGPPQ